MSTAPETSYKDVAKHCELLQQGKQQKMTLLTIASRNASNVSASSIDKARGGIPKVCLQNYDEISIHSTMIKVR